MTGHIARGWKQALDGRGIIVARSRLIETTLVLNNSHTIINVQFVLQSPEVGKKQPAFEFLCCHFLPCCSMLGNGRERGR